MVSVENLKKYLMYPSKFGTLRHQSKAETKIELCDLELIFKVKKAIKCNKNGFCLLSEEIFYEC